MARTKMEKNMANLNAKKVALDKEINAYLEMNELAKSYAKKAKEMLATLEARYQHGPEVAEIIEGKTMAMEKIVVHNKPKFDNNAIATVLLNNDINPHDYIHTIINIEVDKKGIDKLVKEGKVSADLVENCISYSLTYKSKFNKLV